MADGVVFAAEHCGFLQGPAPLVPEVVDGHDGEEWPGLEPFFFDEVEAVADHERKKKQEEEKQKQVEERRKRRSETYARIRDYDPKQEGEYITRFCFADPGEFDIDEESDLGPMRYTDKVYKGKYPYKLQNAINILSIKIASLDVKFPVHVYGTVIARDSLDWKCVYLFRRHRDHCQVINSKKESLIIEGPKRGLVLMDMAYFEIDLKIKDTRGKKLRRPRDRELSKGLVSIRGCRLLEECEVEREYLATRLSTMEVMYAVLKKGVEATIAIEVVKGRFDGKITACTTSIPDSMVLHDSKVAGNKKDGGVTGVIQLVRPIVAVCMEDMLMIVAQPCDGMPNVTIEFTPRLNGAREGSITVGVTKLRVKVTWSITW